MVFRPVLWFSEATTMNGGIMSAKPEEYARLLASALCKLHAAECGGPSPLLSDDSFRVMRETIATAMEDAGRSRVEQVLAAMQEQREHFFLHS